MDPTKLWLSVLSKKSETVLCAELRPMKAKAVRVAVNMLAVREC